MLIHQLIDCFYTPEDYWIDTLTSEINDHYDDALVKLDTIYNTVTVMI